jgi:hypothetical protein
MEKLEPVQAQSTDQSSTHLLEIRSILRVPGGQLMQAEEPKAGAYRPSAHDAQPPSIAYVPGAHTIGVREPEHEGVVEGDSEMVGKKEGEIEVDRVRVALHDGEGAREGDTVTLGGSDFVIVGDGGFEEDIVVDGVTEDDTLFVGGRDCEIVKDGVIEDVFVTVGGSDREALDEGVVDTDEARDGDSVGEGARVGDSVEEGDREGVGGGHTWAGLPHTTEPP